MGAGMSGELGQRSLLGENRETLESTKQRLAARDPTLLDVDLANRFIGNKGLIEHVSCLGGGGSASSSSNPSPITRLDLSYNQLTHECIPALLAAVQTGCPNLKVLDLAGNKLGTEGCKLLGEYLSANPQLEELYLFHNDLTDHAVVPFANALLRNDKLAVLNLDENNLTNASWVMLHKAIVVGGADPSGNPLGNSNKGLIKLKVGLARGGNVVPSEAIVDDVNSKMAKNRLNYDERKAEEKARADRAKQAIDAQTTQQKEAQKLAEEQLAAQQRADEEAIAQRRAEEEAMLEYEAKAQQQQNGSKQRTKEQIAADKERWVARAMDQAYGWRQKLTQDGTLVKEWRDGFTTLTTRPGDELGSKPTATIGPPRRLQACWCDPHDVSVPYAKTLHYHCRHEDLNKPLQDGQVPKYEGCCGTGHVCSSVGFYSKPKPDLSASHFFSSPQRAAREEGNDVFEDGNMTHMSRYSQSQNTSAAGY